MMSYVNLYQNSVNKTRPIHRVLHWVQHNIGNGCVHVRKPKPAHSHTKSHANGSSSIAYCWIIWRQVFHVGFMLHWSPHFISHSLSLSAFCCCCSLLGTQQSRFRCECVFLLPENSFLSKQMFFLFAFLHKMNAGIDGKTEPINSLDSETEKKHSFSIITVKLHASNAVQQASILSG